MRISILSLAVLSLFSACRKKPDPVAVNASSARVTIDNIAGNQPFEFNKWYLNQAGDSFQVKIYRYYISNIAFTTADGLQIKEPESYHLIAHDMPSSRSFKIDSLPQGEITAISFILGVDSTRNISGAQQGALDPSNGMFWDWNTGYIMAKMEGSSPSSPYAHKGFFYHTNGFTGPHHSLRKVTLTFPSPVTLKPGSTPNIHIEADILEWFKTPNTIKIADMPFAMSYGEEVSSLADNYADMFKLSHVE